MKIKVGDIVVVNNQCDGLVECPIIYVNDRMIVAKSKYYNIVLNILSNRKFNRYIDEFNELVKIKVKTKRRKEEKK